jgi:hypothetical protein
MILQSRDQRCRGEAVCRRAWQLVFENVFLLNPGVLQRSQLHVGVLVDSRYAGVAVFHGPIMKHQT